MASSKIKGKVAGNDFEGVPIGIAESTERWSEATLEDGAVIRYKTVLVEIARTEGQYDQEGNPIYFAKTNLVMTVNAPDHLKQSPSSQTH
jgi:hypothetical protein